MPTYVYRCPKGHQMELAHGIQQDPIVTCRHGRCRLTMHRVPQMVRVNWGGLPPHLEHTRNRAVQEVLDPNAIAQRRDEYERNLSIVRNKKGDQP